MIERLFQLLHDNWIGVILMMTLTLFVIYLVAFFANGLFSTKFDLTSCWTGVGAIATAAATGYSKWWTDSKYNSSLEKMPTSGGENNNE